MSGIETRFGAEEDAERIRAAFYGFVGAHDGADVDGDARISTEIDIRGPRLSVRLWSAEAMDAFLRDLGRPSRRACYE
ncbi:hypothetical protein [Phenylobacterium sp.]|uniref:hypothetical protein n=1 Tax=Phenylobacterium sp. TaxID=1871053 RepID=UPI0025E15323|nr:hypothetical protein [Phenylobacterium sp.]MBX3486149.1 hypothetical protein [Phenylobacterium sp.]MCW5760949.1 hypothetical protein [Phenylobacterium sp.]